jgi:hypothetical protein
VVDWLVIGDLLRRSSVSEPTGIHSAVRLASL